MIHLFPHVIFCTRSIYFHMWFLFSFSFFFSFKQMSHLFPHLILLKGFIHLFISHVIFAYDWLSFKCDSFHGSYLFSTVSHLFYFIFHVFLKKQKNKKTWPIYFPIWFVQIIHLKFVIFLHIHLFSSVTFSHVEHEFLFTTFYVISRLVYFNIWCQHDPPPLQNPFLFTFNSSQVGSSH